MSSCHVLAPHYQSSLIIVIESHSLAQIEQSSPAVTASLQLHLPLVSDDQILFISSVTHHLGQVRVSSVSDSRVGGHTGSVAPRLKHIVHTVRVKYDKSRVRLMMDSPVSTIDTTLWSRDLPW